MNTKLAKSVTGITVAFMLSLAPLFATIPANAASTTPTTPKKPLGISCSAKAIKKAKAYKKAHPKLSTRKNNPCAY